MRQAVRGADPASDVCSRLGQKRGDRRPASPLLLMAPGEPQDMAHGAFTGARTRQGRSGCCPDVVEVLSVAIDDERVLRPLEAVEGDDARKNVRVVRVAAEQRFEVRRQHIDREVLRGVLHVLTLICDECRDGEPVCGRLTDLEAR